MNTVAVLVLISMPVIGLLWLISKANKERPKSKKKRKKK